jgi:hypothetical protein
LCDNFSKETSARLFHRSSVALKAEIGNNPHHPEKFSSSPFPYYKCDNIRSLPIDVFAYFCFLLFLRSGLKNSVAHFFRKKKSAG